MQLSIDLTPSSLSKQTAVAADFSSKQLLQADFVLLKGSLWQLLILGVAMIWLWIF